MKGVIPVFLLFWVGLSFATKHLAPPYFNAPSAKGVSISASSTCGESADGPHPDKYCTLIGAMLDNVMDGKYCGECKKGDHSAMNMLDGSEDTWWQSPPLSRGVRYNKVNLTIDLGQELEVAYINIQMANSPRPAVWVVERSNDNGATFQPWQYFARNESDCEQLFGQSSTRTLEFDDSVMCDTIQTRVVPLENGEVFMKLPEGRPSARNYFSSKQLQKFTRATHIRIRFLETNYLYGHLSAMSIGEPSVMRRYFYSVKGIEIGARCACNGHADSCSHEGYDSSKLRCKCENHTCGDHCETCCPGYGGYPHCDKQALKMDPTNEEREESYNLIDWLASMLKKFVRESGH